MSLTSQPSDPSYFVITFWEAANKNRHRCRVCCEKIYKIRPLFRSVRGK